MADAYDEVLNALHSLQTKVRSMERDYNEVVRELAEVTRERNEADAAFKEMHDAACEISAALDNAEKAMEHGCDNGCGRPVSTPGATCQGCWAEIDKAKPVCHALAGAGSIIKIQGTGTVK